MRGQKAFLKFPLRGLGWNVAPLLPPYKTRLKLTPALQNMRTWLGVSVIIKFAYTPFLSTDIIIYSLAKVMLNYCLIKLPHARTNYYTKYLHCAASRSFNYHSNPYELRPSSLESKYEKIPIVINATKRDISSNAESGTQGGVLEQDSDRMFLLSLLPHWRKTNYKQRTN
uniref:BESS domain-containing protein n=1 Tax=Glossina austeni TaxID=7395 RepID=A0A1A9URF2_GLOAU